MPRLIAALIRHGDSQQLPDTPSAHQPFALTATGEEQSRQAAIAIREAIERHHWALSAEIDSSRLLRAWQTAQIIGRSLTDCFPEPLQLSSYDELAERGLGSAANLSIVQIEQIIHDDPRFTELPADWKSNSHFCLPLQGAESLMQAGERVAAHLQQQMQALKKTSENDCLKLFIGHGAAFRHAAYHLGILEFDQIAQLSMYHAQPVFIEYLADNRWQHIDGEWKVRDTDLEPVD